MTKLQITEKDARRDAGERAKTSRAMGYAKRVKFGSRAAFTHHGAG